MVVLVTENFHTNYNKFSDVIDIANHGKTCQKSMLHFDFIFRYTYFLFCVTVSFLARTFALKILA